MAYLDEKVKKPTKSQILSDKGVWRRHTLQRDASDKFEEYINWRRQVYLKTKISYKINKGRPRAFTKGRRQKNMWRRQRSWVTPSQRQHGEDETLIGGELTASHL